MVRRSHFQREAYALEQALLKEIYALLSEGSLEDSACIQELVSKLPGLHIPLFAGEETLCETRMFPIFFHLLASGNVS
mgnify:FL=1